MASVGSWVLDNSSSPATDDPVLSFFKVQFASEISEDTESGPLGPHSSETGDVRAGPVGEPTGWEPNTALACRNPVSTGPNVRHPK